MMRRDEGRGFGVAEDKKLELKLGPPGQEDWSSTVNGSHSNNEAFGSFSASSKTQNGKRGFPHTVEEEVEEGGEGTWLRNNNGNHNTKHPSTNTWCSTSSQQSPCPSGFQTTQQQQQQQQQQHQNQKHSFLGFPSNSQNLPVLAKESSQICGQKNISELQHNTEKKACSPASANTAVNNNNNNNSNNSQKRTAPAPVVGWPPIRSFRRNLASSCSKPAPESQEKAPLKETSTVVKPPEVCRKGLFVKINMDGVPIGRKVDLKAYDSYDKLSSAVDELFRGLLTAQRDSSADLNCKHVEEVRKITGLLDGSGEYTLVYEDNEGDRMLVGDVPWDMFTSAVKRLRVLKSSELSALRLGSNKQGKTQLECAVVK